MMRGIYLLWLSLFFGNLAQAQDVHFGQFYASPLYLSPSFTGAIPGSRIATNYRDQWPELPGTFVSYAVSYDHNFSSFNSGFGVLVFQDRAGSGDFNTTNVSFTYSYDFQINRLWHVRPGLGFTYLQRGININKLLFVDQMVSSSNPQTSVEVPPLETVHNVDASTSVLTYNEFFWFGLTVDHLMRPDVSFFDEKIALPIKYSVYSGYKFMLLGPTRKTIPESITAAFHYRKQGDFNQLDVGGYYQKEPLIFGVWYRGIPIGRDLPANDAISVLAGVGFNNFRFIYSYDFVINKLISHTKGAHEISLNYSFVIKQKKKFKPLPCPHF